MRVHLKVKRYDPAAGDQSARYDDYTLDVLEYATVLDSLLEVHDYQDGSLALRYSCRSASCGSCAMRIDNKARLACKTKVVDLVQEEGQEILVAPLGNMPVIKDLVTDMEVYWSKVRQVTPWLQPSGAEPEREYLVANEAMRDLARTMNCIHCGACVSDCTVLEVDTKFIGPAALAKAYRFVGDPRESRDPAEGVQKQRLEYLSNTAGGIWDCTRCNMCVEVCPKDVRPMDRIMQLREITVESGVRSGIGYRHTQAFAGSVRRLGRLDEARMLPDSVGIYNVPRLLSELPGALRMFRAGKLPWSHALPWHKPIPGIKHVRHIFDTVRRAQKGKASQ